MGFGQWESMLRCRRAWLGLLGHQSSVTEAWLGQHHGQRPGQPRRCLAWGSWLGDACWISGDQVKPPLGGLSAHSRGSAPPMSYQPRRRQMTCFLFRTESAMVFDWKITDFGLTFCFTHNNKVRSTCCQKSFSSHPDQGGYYHWGWLSCFLWKNSKGHQLFKSDFH